MLENESKFVFYILIILYHKRLFFFNDQRSSNVAPLIFPCHFFPLHFRLYIKCRYIFISGENMDESAIIIRLGYSRDTREVENTQLLYELFFLFSSKGI